MLLLITCPDRIESRVGRDYVAVVGATDPGGHWVRNSR